MDLGAFLDLLTPRGERLLTRVTGELDADPAPEPLAVATRLRREYPAHLVTAALTQARLRARAREKFGSDAAHMYFTPEGLEQATRGSVAAHRARRYGVRGPPPWCADLCCGVGGDLVALARAGCRVEGIDRDPLIVEVARANAAALGVAHRVRLHRAEVETVDTTAYDAAFCDPARRASGARRFDPAAYSPPLQQAVRLVRESPAGAVKVAPGIGHQQIPADAEAEWVSDHGEVKEATLWFGDLAAAPSRRATLLPTGATLTAAIAGSPAAVSGGERPGAPDAADIGHPGRYLYEPDGAVIRAGLVTSVAAAIRGWLLDPTIAYITSDHLTETPFATSYEITDVLPFSVKRLRALLRERRVGAVTIKKRGSAVEVERLRSQLRLSGHEQAVLVLTRLAGAHHVLICRPSR